MAEIIPKNDKGPPLIPAGSAKLRASYQDTLFFYRSSAPYTSDYRGRRNPYTGKRIENSHDWDFYLQIKAMHTACDEEYQRLHRQEVQRQRWMVWQNRIIALLLVLVLGLSFGLAISSGGKSRASPPAATSSSSSGPHSGNGPRAEPAVETTCIGNKATKKYHVRSCSYLPDAKNQVSFSSFAAAERAGYSPCGHCIG